MPVLIPFSDPLSHSTIHDILLSQSSSLGSVLTDIITSNNSILSYLFIFYLILITACKGSELCGYQELCYQEFPSVDH